jgi:hypothetical protein
MQRTEILRRTWHAHLKGRIWFESEYREFRSSDRKCGLKMLIAFLDSLVEEVVMGMECV